MSTARVLDAVNFLIESPHYSSLIGEMTRIIENWDAHQMRYGGDLARLNYMLDVGVQSRAAFEGLIDLIEAKRKLHPRVRRTDYQRDLMRDRRAREAKAIALHEIKFGTVKGADRIREIASIRERWNRAKKEYVAAKAPSTWSERNEVTREFWGEIDRQLDVNLAQTRHKVYA